MRAIAPGAGVLVVDDTLENLRLLAGMLGAAGYEVRPVPSGRQALQAARQSPPEVILLDITMPEMDGFETCARFKAEEALREIPIIFLTALTDTADKIKAFKAGGADYITKPFNIEEVLARVNVHVGLRRASVELKQSLDKLRALEHLRDNLVHMVVHDMRSPLTAMLGHLELLAMDAGPRLDDNARKDLTAVTESAQAVNAMANDLLDVSRLEAGQLPLNVQAHDLSDIAAAVRRDLAGWARQRPLEIESAGATTSRCDAGVMRRVLTNLLNNALKHTPASGRIWVRINCANGRARVEVHDEGPGVPTEARQRIFEKFGTVTTRSDRTYHSAGLGLAFCKLAIEAHGGTIGVDSRDPCGSVFWLEWPA